MNISDETLYMEHLPASWLDGWIGSVDSVHIIFVFYLGRSLGNTSPSFAFLIRSSSSRSSFASCSALSAALMASCAFCSRRSASRFFSRISISLNS